MKNFLLNFRMGAKQAGLLSAFILVISVVRIVVIWQLAFERVDFEKSEAIRHEFSQNAHIAAAVEDHTERTLKALEKTFDLIEKQYRSAGSNAGLNRFLVDLTLDSPSLTSLALIDVSGNVMAGPGNSLARHVGDSEYFKHHQAINDSRLYVGKPVIGHVADKWTLPISRRINRPDSSFGGVILGNVDAPYFTDVALKTDAGSPRNVALVGQDKTVRAAWTGKQNSSSEGIAEDGLWQAQQKWLEGNLIEAGSTDGISRLYSYRRLMDYPLFVAVGITETDALAGLADRHKKYYGTAALATLTVLFVAALLLWLLHRHRLLKQDISKSRALQRASFKLAATGMAQVDIGGHYLQVNDKLCSMLGCGSNELTGTSIFKQIHLEDVEALKIFLESLREEPDGRDAGALELRYLHRDASTVWVLLSVSVVPGATGSESYFIFALQDITDRKQVALDLHKSNQQLASAFENSAIGMALVMPDGRWLKINSALCSMLGYTQAELMASSLLQITHADDLAPSIDQMQELLHGTGDHYRMEKRLLHRQGHPVWVSQLISLVRDADGQALHLIVQVTDIHQQKTAENEIGRLHAGLEDRVRQRTQELHFATREITDFSYSMAHDLRQPLSSIMGFGDLLERELSGQLSERSTHCLARIRAGIHQISDLTEALVALAQLSSVALNYQTTDLSQIAKVEVERCRRPEPDRQADVEIQGNMLALGDPQLLTVVMKNLIANAWKFSARMTRTHIEVGSEAGEDGQAVYFVRDKGAGFDMAYSEKLFGNFQRLHSPSEFLGHGIGLASARRVIARHGGKIWAQSAPGQGAVFYFTLGKPPAPT